MTQEQGYHVLQRFVCLIAKLTPTLAVLVNSITMSKHSPCVNTLNTCWMVGGEDGESEKLAVTANRTQGSLA